MLLDTLIKVRLVVTDSSPDGTPTVSLAHEALLRHWDRLSAWVEANRKELDIRARVGVAMERWRRGGRTSDLLLPEGAPLEEGLALLRSWGDELPEPEREFIARSAERARGNLRLKLGAIVALGALTVIAVVLSVVARYQSGRASDEARKAKEAATIADGARNDANVAAGRAKESEQKAKNEARLADSRRIAALSESVRGSNLDRSLILAVEALHLENTNEARQSLFTAPC